MERNEVLANIIEYASRAYEKPVDEINENTKISEELGVRSMQRVALSASIENEYDVMIQWQGSASLRRSETLLIM